jgi:hypothetical protein
LLRDRHGYLARSKNDKRPRCRQDSLCRLIATGAGKLVGVGNEQNPEWQAANQANAEAFDASYEAMDDLLETTPTTPPAPRHCSIGSVEP